MIVTDRGCTYYTVTVLWYDRMSAAQRRNRFDRTGGHRASFDILQAELESFVETLSGTAATTATVAAAVIFLCSMHCMS